MIILQMMGNLGNQLFIYAMARALQMEYGDDIVIDLGGLKRFYYSASYKLDHMNLPQSGISTDLSSVNGLLKLKYNITSKLYHVEQRIFRSLRKDSLVPDFVTRNWFNRGCYYNFSRSYYEYLPTNSPDKLVYGYFQSEKYFEKYRDVIVNDCQVTDPKDEYDEKWLPIIDSVNSVAVSVRAINELGVSFIDYDYYYRGMEEIAKRIENPVFFVFSDDIEATKKLMQFPYPVEYMTPADACHGLRLMYNCKHFVIANSTFSWWGAYLAKNPNKIITMPDKIDKGGFGREDYYIRDAIRLPCSFVDYKINLDQIKNQKYAK